jgi:hypothetical protein
VFGGLFLDCHLGLLRIFYYIVESLAGWRLFTFDRLLIISLRRYSAASRPVRL